MLMHGTRRRPRRKTVRERGQVMVLFALSVAVLLTAAGLAIDMGRFYSERRFLQNAADAAALAAANAMIRGETATVAEAEARAILAKNFVSGINGSPSLPSTTPIYLAGHLGDPTYLVEGILVGTGDVRVAVRHDVGYTMARIAGFDTATIGATARATWRGRLLPIAVPRYLNPGGPYNPLLASCPLSINLSAFVDVFATHITACLGDLLDLVFRLLPNPGAPWDPLNPENDIVNHGPVVPILGQGAQPPNNADFRGFVALDIRNFATTGSQLYYNGVTASTSAPALKGIEANWIYRKGYPGPDFPPATMPPDPNDQVATLSGNSTGAAIDAMIATYAPGDEILVCVYSGSVSRIPDFAITAPNFIDLPVTGLTVNAGELRVSRNQEFSGTVALSTLADTLDPHSPMMLGTLLGLDPILYLPNPVTPSLGTGTSVLMNQLLTLGATPGIFNVWIKGQAGSPYLTTKFVPVPVKIGTVTRDFTLTANAQAAQAANVGDDVTFTLTLTNAPNKNTNFGGPVTLSVDPALPSGIGAPARTGIGAITFGSTTVTPTKLGASTTLTIDTGALAPGVYDVVVRATGYNSDVLIPRKVTHLLPLTIHVATSSSSMEYVDIVGFAVMRLVSLDANTVTAYAITPVYPDMNDPRLMRGRSATLVPWS